MGVKVVATGLNWWSQPLLSQPSLRCSSSISPIRRQRKTTNDGECDHTVTCHYHVFRDSSEVSSFLGTKFPRARSSLDDKYPTTNRWQQQQQQQNHQDIRRAISAHRNFFRYGDQDDEGELAAGRIHESSSLALICHHPQEAALLSCSPVRRASHVSPPPWLGIRPEPPDWAEERSELVFTTSLERKANSLGLPLSLRILKKRREEAGKSVSWCSARRAFSSMVFIIREMQNHVLFQEEDVVVARVQKETHAPFCWLFAHIFSCTPTLMVSLMLLLANFAVYSMAHNAVAIAHVMPPQSHATTTTTTVDDELHHNRKTPLPSKMFDASPMWGAAEEEGRLWRRMLQEAERMQSDKEALMDHETLQRLVSPVTAEVEADLDYPEYLRTDLMYLHAVSQLDPDGDPLLLCNYAQFLFLVAHDHDRAEYYFKRAVAAQQPPDAESLSQYANFLWVGKKDLVAAEETYLEAIAADPANTFHAANYAHFLWNTGGDDTCFPLGGRPHEEQEDEDGETAP